LKNLLIVGHTFPEPKTTAAGGRMMQLIDLFLEEGYQITFASTANSSERSEDLSNLGVFTKNIELNNSSFDVFISKLKPAVVVFDRYITEEQFGWRVSEKCPNALRILDTEDLHFLRKAREEAVKKNIPAAEANLFTETTKRELASILRSDISLIISEYELKLLKETFRIPSEILHYLPFLVNKTSKMIEKEPFFEERADFVTIGNLLHAPNVNSVLRLKKEIWPLIRKELSQGNLCIYGAYAPQQILELHNEKEGFLVRGWAKDVSEVLKNARVCLAPIQFGAGLKGKLLDAMLNGTPSVTTTIGAEGMQGDLPFSGIIEDDSQEFANASVKLYSEQKPWLKYQQYGFDIIENRFQKDLFSEAFKQLLINLQGNISEHRKYNFIGQILQHQTLQSTRYMSKWIEEKNQLKSEK
jgi:glycosyltransferase involved in cell wall biosynthesis